MDSTINFYLFCEKLKSNYDAFSQIGQIYYPLKTNSNEIVIEALDKLYSETDNGFLITHYSHFKQLIDQGISPDKMCLANVLANDNLIKELYFNGVRYFTFDNIESLSKFLEYANPSEVKISIRFSIIEAFGTFSHLGASVKECNEMFELLKSKNISNYGISFYLQKELFPNSNSLNIMLDYIKNAFRDYKMSFINIGGAIKPEDIDIAKLDEVKNTFSAEKIIVEPGRYLVGNAGYMKTRVIKKKYDNVFIIDAGIYAGLLDALLYNKQYELYLKTSSGYIPLFAKSFPNSKEIIICGASSDSGDRIGKFYIDARYFSNLDVGSTLVVNNALAYVEEFFMPLGGDLKPRYTLIGEDLIKEKGVATGAKK